MSHASYLTWRLLILSLFAVAIVTVQASGFEPSITMLGFASSTNVGEEVEWMLTFSNAGDTAGQNIVISTTMGNGLQVENAQFSTGTTTINGNTITASIPMLESSETIQLNILTSIAADADFSAVSCVTASNLSGESCVRGLPVQALPATGETPFWRQPFLWLGVMTVSVSLVLIGLGLLGLQSLQAHDDNEYET